MSKQIGILTAGGDSPGLNAAIRGIGKCAMAHGFGVIGFQDGFRGLMENRTVRLDNARLSGILSVGGTILGTSRDKPHRMVVGDTTMDMTNVMVSNLQTLHLDALVCLGGGGTQKNAFRLAKAGANIITLPKTIDNDVYGTDVTFGFDTALGICTEAIDRLHSTAHSHHRIIVVEVMGNNAGWLALGSGVAGGADVVLLPEIPYHLTGIAERISQRRRQGKNFSIVAVAEGAMPAAHAELVRAAEQRKQEAPDKAAKAAAKDELAALAKSHRGNTMRLAQRLESLTGLEARVTILGHVQRGGTPSAADRILATHLGTAAVDLIAKGTSGVMVAARHASAVAVPLEKIVGKRKTVPLDHAWIAAARSLGMALGD